MSRSAAGSLGRPTGAPSRSPTAPFFAANDARRRPGHEALAQRPAATPRARSATSATGTVAGSSSTTKNSRSNSAANTNVSTAAAALHAHGPRQHRAEQRRDEQVAVAHRDRPEQLALELRQPGPGRRGDQRRVRRLEQIRDDEPGVRARPSARSRVFSHPGGVTAPSSTPSVTQLRALEQQRAAASPTSDVRDRPRQREQRHGAERRPAARCPAPPSPSATAASSGTATSARYVRPVAVSDDVADRKDRRARSRRSAPAPSRARAGGRTAQPAAATRGAATTPACSASSAASDQTNGRATP